MKYALVFIIIISFSSCCGIHNEVKYQYQNILVTRIDECGETSFYYGDGQDRNGRIWAKYSGINDGFKGYLQFNKNGKVTILSGDGYFQIENIDTSQFEYKRIAAYERPKISKTVCYINLATKFEQEDNLAAGSGIKAEYKIDDNEWW